MRHVQIALITLCTHNCYVRAKGSSENRDQEYAKNQRDRRYFSRTSSRTRDTKKTDKRSNEKGFEIFPQAVPYITRNIDRDTRFFVSSRRDCKFVGISRVSGGPGGAGSIVLTFSFNRAVRF